MTSFYQLQAQTFYLSGAGAVAGATSITLQSFTDIDGAVIAMTDLGSIAYMTLEPGNSTLEEQISFTGVTQNANGTATLTGVKTVLFKTPYTETSGLAKTHAGSTSAILSNTAGYYQQFVHLENDETIIGKKTFPAGGATNAPVSGASYSAPTDDLEYASKKYIDDIAIAGAPDATLSVKGIVEIGTTAEIDAGTTTGSTGASLAVRPDQLAASIYGLQLPSSDQKAALAGTSGTPSVSNKYVTADDVTEAKTASKIPRRDSNSDILVATTPTAGDAATSKTYVDAKFVLATTLVACGTASYTTSSGNGNLTIAHGLGVVPKMIRISCTTSSTYTNQVQGGCSGVATSTSNEYSISFQGNASASITTSKIISLRASDATESVAGDLTTLDATNIVIALTFTNKTGDGTTKVMWEAIY